MFRWNMRLELEEKLRFMYELHDTTENSLHFETTDKKNYKKKVGLINTNRISQNDGK